MKSQTFAETLMMTVLCTIMLIGWTVFTSVHFGQSERWELYLMGIVTSVLGTGLIVLLVLLNRKYEADRTLESRERDAVMMAELEVETD